MTLRDIDSKADELLKEIDDVENFPSFSASEPPASRPAKSRFMHRTEMHPRSHQLLQVWNSDDRKAQALKLYEDQFGKGPLIEEIAGDPDSVLVSFLYLGDEETVAVWIWGGPACQGRPFTPLLETDLWYYTETVRRNALFSYSLTEYKAEVVNQRKILVAVEDLADHANEQVTTYGNSMVKMPGTPEPAPMNRGACKELVQWVIDSGNLRSSRTFSVYRWGSAPPKGLLIVLDGEAFAAGWPALETGPFVDTPALLEASNLPPLLTAFIHVGDSRDEDLLFNPKYADFIADELIPRLSEKVGQSFGPEHTIIAGASFGGIGAAYVAHRRWERIGNVISLSGSFWVDQVPVGEDIVLGDGLIQKLYLNSEKRPIRFYLDAGTYEELSRIAMPNRHLRDILLLQGYDVTYHEFPANHDYMRWADALIEGLTSLTSAWGQ